MNLKSDKENRKKLLPLEIMLTTLFVFTFILLIISTVSPIIFNFKEVNLIGKILLILGTMFSLLLLISLIVINIKAKNAKKLHFICSMMLFFFVWGISILHYINFNLWGIKLEFWISFIIIVFLIGVFSNAYKIVKGVSKNLVIDILLACNLAIYLIGFIACLTLKSWLYVQIGIGFSYILIVLYFLNKFLIKKDKLIKNKYLPILTQVLLITVLIITTIFTLPVYLNWIGLQGKVMDYFITIYSCLIGGIVTLCGVAWTIKNQEKIREEEKIKLQKKDRLKYKPYFNGNADKFLTVDAKRHFILQHAAMYNKDKLSTIKLNENDKIFYIYPIRFLNSDNSNFIIKKITLNGTECERKNFLINKNETFDLQALHFIVSKGESIPEIKIFIKDFLENEYMYKINFNVREEELGYSQDGGWSTKSKELKMFALIMDSVEELKLNGEEDFKNGSGLHDK